MCLQITKMDFVSLGLCTLYFVAFFLIVSVVHRHYQIHEKLKNIPQVGRYPFGAMFELLNLSNYDMEARLQMIINEGAKSLMDFDNAKPELPSFYDEKKFRLGQQAFYNNIFSMMIAKLCGLLSLLAIPSILNVLVFTKKSGTACLAYKRYAETILHTQIWLEKDPNGQPIEFNLCSGTIEETRALCQRLLEEVFIAALSKEGRKKNVHFDHMSNTLLKGVWSISTSVDPIGFLAFILYLASSTARNKNHSIEMDSWTMPFYSWYLFNWQHFIFKYLMRPNAWRSLIFRTIFNTSIRLSIFCLKHFSFLAYWTFGKK
ncbi:uncharacterized protein LOC105203925 isoform X1 [Solenopsis invicta]|uniref:uncharacterized protein LOC105203925 isoform X1 n=1 Tax=Solenopsis invicta TaxID=13686 RepID=UPI00193CF884|nr:uncharacterized protein LOC105203925 isoform X1 [Solenopsis invicta]XP_039315506.1 uncharacterized protein LOC105203925 isoform X1 [Solenopsis invicta]